jgi:spore germination protein KC
MRRARAALSSLLAIVLVAFVTSGCWDRRELEERTSVVALSIDHAERKAEDQPLLKLSVQIPIPIKIVGAGGSGAGEGGKKAVKVMSATGYTMADAMRNLQTRLNQQLFYGHTRVIAVSEDVAREHMASIIDSLRRSPQLRRLLWLVITPGEAVSLLESDPKLEQIPIVYVMDLIENGSKVGTVPDITLGRWFVDRSSSGVAATANYILPQKQEVKWKGLAVFRQDQFVGNIDEKEAWVLMQVRDKQIGGDLTIACPTSAKMTGSGTKDYVTAHPKKIHVESKIEPYGNTFRMAVEILVETDIVESMCGINFKKEDAFRNIQQALANELNKRAEKLVFDAQNKFVADIFGMGNKVRAKYLNEFESMDWEKEFPNTKIDIHYSVKIRRVGMKME